MLFRTFVGRFLGGGDASGHNFGGIFVTFGVPGPLWAPLGVPFLNFGRPGGEKGRTREIPPAKGLTPFSHYWAHVRKQTLSFL